MDEDPDIIEQKVLKFYSELKKNYEDEFTYQGLNLFFIFRHKIIYFLSFLLFFQNSFSNFIKREKITKVLYLGLSDISKNIFMEICRKNNIGYQKFHSYQLSEANLSSILHHKILYKILTPLLLNTRKALKKLYFKFMNRKYKLEPNLPTENSTKKKIVFLLFSLNHWVMIKPIFELLNKNTDIELFALNMSSPLVNNEFRNELDSYNVKSINVEYLPKKFNIKLSEYKKYNIFIGNLLKKFKKPHYFGNSSSNFSGDNSNIINFGLFTIFRRYEFLKLNNSFQHANELIHPDLCVFLNDLHEFGRTFYNSCRKIQAPAIYIPHAFVGGVPYGPLFMEYAFLTGKMEREYYNSRIGNVNKNLVIKLVGKPKLDEIYQYLKDNKDKEVNQQEIKQKLGFSNDSKIILLATSPYNNNLKELVIKTTINTLEKYDDIKLVIKLHPRESSDELHKKIAQESHMSDRIIVLKHKDTSLFDLINISEVIIGGLSGALVEAVFFDKDVICLNFSPMASNYGDVYQLSKYNSSLFVKKPHNLQQIIDALINGEINLNQERKRYRDDYYKNFDGKSSFRMYNEILDIIKYQNLP